MPFSYRIDKDAGVIFVGATGRLTPRSLLDCMKSYYADSAFHPDVNMLFEIRDDANIRMRDKPNTAAIPKTESKIIDRVRSLAQEKRGDSEYRMACAGGTREKQAFFLTGMQLANSRSQTKAFDEVEDALAWLQGSGQQAA